MDERTFFAQTKQQGFYVSSGEVALLKDKYMIQYYLYLKCSQQSFRTPKKPKSKKISLAGPSAKISAANGSTISRHDRSRDSPAPVTSDDEKKRKSSEEHGDSSKKRKTNEVHTFHPELEAELERLKAEIAKGEIAAIRVCPLLMGSLAQNLGRPRASSHPASNRSSVRYH